MRFLKAWSLDANKLLLPFGHSTFSESPAPRADTFVVVSERKECISRVERALSRVWVLAGTGRLTWPQKWAQSGILRLVREYVYA